MTVGSHVYKNDEGVIISLTYKGGVWTSVVQNKIEVISTKEFSDFSEAVNKWRKLVDRVVMGGEIVVNGKPISIEPEPSRDFEQAMEKIADKIME